MKPGHTLFRSLNGNAFASSCLLLLAFFLCLATSIFAQEFPALETLTSAEQIRRLTPEQAARHYPVKLRGVVTFFDQSLYLRFVQDGTAGIYIGDNRRLAPLTPGQEIEITGEAYPGEYAPILMPKVIRVVGRKELPDAKPMSYDQLITGQQDSQFVEIQGVVRSAHFDSLKNHELIEIVTGGGRVTAYAKGLPASQLQDLVDSTVRVRGVCVSMFNQQRQLFRLRLMVPRPEDLVVEQYSTTNGFSLPLQSIVSLQQFAPEGSYGHRARISGTVIYWQGNDTYIEDAKGGLHVQIQQSGALQVGDQVEVVGFPSHGAYTPRMDDAVYRKTASATQLPEPKVITADEGLKGASDCRLVRIEATLLERVRQRREQYLVLQSGGITFNANLDVRNNGGVFASVQNGSKVAVTGVCVIEPGSDWYAGEDWRAKSFHILLRSADDVFVVQSPPWWTLKKMLWMVGILCLIVPLALTWVVVLGNRVRAQTKIIRQKLETEATLKERYVDLFENANDVVYTHDLSGRITSINHAGERLLQQPREKILTRNIVDFVVKDEQTAARQWLNEVTKGAETPTVEWDINVPASQPVKLEISTRLIRQQGRGVEIEGIARDITERKRLEREILEISNREHRRIGHDLHDGICQLLAGIALMSESLADLLNQKGVKESAQAERISVLMHNAINQTRGVARGLFPVRLEENGLASALEELAANAGELFKIDCCFLSNHPPSGVDNEIALHVYYIALEAVANAAKHGKARNVIITLDPMHGRYLLGIKDDGIGFSLRDSPQTGMGIRIMQYRARVIGTTLSLESRPDHGTYVTCLFPISRGVSKAAVNGNGNGNGNGKHEALA